jgi:hypothetical protein
MHVNSTIISSVLMLVDDIAILHLVGNRPIYCDEPSNYLIMKMMCIIDLTYCSVSWRYFGTYSVFFHHYWSISVGVIWSALLIHLQTGESNVTNSETTDSTLHTRQRMVVPMLAYGTRSKKNKANDMLVVPIVAFTSATM